MGRAVTTGLALGHKLEFLTPYKDVLYIASDDLADAVYRITAE